MLLLFFFLALGFAASPVERTCAGALDRRPGLKRAQQAVPDLPWGTQVAESSGSPARSVQAEMDHVQSAARPDRERFLADLREEMIFDRLVVSTHQSLTLQAPTATWLERDARVRGLPVLALVSREFPMRDPALAARATFIYSDSGRLGGLGIARDVFVVGGFDQHCLRRTLEGLAINAKSAGIETLTIHLVSDLIYTTQGAPLDKLFTSGSDAGPRARSTLIGMFGHHEIFNDKVWSSRDDGVLAETILVDSHRHESGDGREWHTSVPTICLSIEKSVLFR